MSGINSKKSKYVLPVFLGIFHKHMFTVFRKLVFALGRIHFQLNCNYQTFVESAGKSGWHFDEQINIGPFTVNHRRRKIRTMNL